MNAYAKIPTATPDGRDPAELGQLTATVDRILPAIEKFWRYNGRDDAAANGLAGWPAWTYPCLRPAAEPGPLSQTWPKWSSRTVRGLVSRAGAASLRPGRPPLRWRLGWRRAWPGPAHGA